MENGDIAVSVLITFYNNEMYVDECIKSVLRQKCDFAYEIVISDDGSTDGSREKISEWQVRYPKIISVYDMERDHEINYLGPVRASRSRLNLLHHVRGRYFIFLDGDDYYLSDDKLQIQVDILENHPEYKACGHMMLLENKKTGESKYLPDMSQEYCKSIRKYWKADYIHTDAILFRSNDIKEINEEILHDDFNDNLITFMLLQRGKIFYYPKVMAEYRWTGEGIWTKQNEYINYLREIMSFEIECKINSKLLNIICLRHFQHLKFFYKLRPRALSDEDERKIEMWKKIMQANNLQLALQCIGIIHGDRRMGKLRYFYWRGFMSYYCFQIKELFKRIMQKIAKSNLKEVGQV